MDQKREAYPLQWPEGWKRTEDWKRGIPQFKAPSFVLVRDRVIRQLQKRGSRVVITSDLPLRLDGLPIANGRCNDPGIAVWWVEKGKEMVIACDRWRNVNLNLSAIDRTLEALRGIDRWGASTMVDKAFAGFAALPPPGGTSDGTDAKPEPIRVEWRRVFDIDTSLNGVLSKQDLLALVKNRYKMQSATAHPDRGGDINKMVLLNAALEAAELELANG